ncbi:glycosyltransferase family 2 protein [Patescibacteria group bacterium]|nr:glycosyltransferase family 2 protein [Patescibacteria group bacterium]
MMLSPWNEIRVAHRNRILKKARQGSLYNPRVSVIVPAWNEENGIITTVEALLKSTYTNMEILVIDNASKDNTGKNVRDLIERYELTRDRSLKQTIDVIYSYEGAQGKGHALNNGLNLATGDIILSIDTDCYVPPETVGNFVKYFQDPTVMAAVGNVRIGNTDTIIGVVQYLEFLFSFYFKKAESLVNTIYIIGGAAGAFRREIFDKIGPYSTTNITEDIELSVRIQAHGMRIAYAPDALVYTEGAVTLSGLMKQRLRWKRGRFETFAEHRGMFCSFKKEHNKLLSWFILPLAIIGELQLSLEILFLTFLYIFSFMTGDFTSFISGIVVVSSMFLVQVAFDKHREATLPFLLLAPIGWLLFYVSTFVETNALFKALWGYIRKQELVWQKWERKGVFIEQK